MRRPTLRGLRTATQQEFDELQSLLYDHERQMAVLKRYTAWYGRAPVVCR